MSDLDLGQATIVYEDTEDGTTEETVDNEQLLYARDHWAIKAGTDERGNDLMKQIPRARVYRVERNVERFEEEVQTVRHRVESMASDLRERLPIDVGEDRSGKRRTAHRTHDEPAEAEATTVPVTGAETGESESEEDPSHGGTKETGP